LESAIARRVARSNATLNWEIAARRKGYEDERLGKTGGPE